MRRARSPSHPPGQLACWIARRPVCGRSARVSMTERPPVMLVRPESWTACGFPPDLRDMKDMNRILVDPLGEALHFLRMSGFFYCRWELTAPGALALPPMEERLLFHVVTSGRCWLEAEGDEPRRLEP